MSEIIAGGEYQMNMINDLRDKIISKKESRMLIKDYPDVLTVKHVSAILGISTKLVYSLLKKNLIGFLKVGRSFRIPKTCLLRYLNDR